MLILAARTSTSWTIWHAVGAKLWVSGGSTHKIFHWIGMANATMGSFDTNMTLQYLYKRTRMRIPKSPCSLSYSMIERHDHYPGTWRGDSLPLIKMPSNNHKILPACPCVKMAIAIEN